MPPPAFTRELLHPRYWFAWLGMAIWFLIAQLPYSVQRPIPHLLMPLLRRNKKRIHQAETNLALCFPELTDSERKILLEESLHSIAITVIETGIAWFWSRRRLRKLFTIKGFEHIQQAEADGQGVLILSLHFTTLDIGGAMLGMLADTDSMYRPHKNKVYDFMQRNRRDAYIKNGSTFSRDNVRAMISRLRQARRVWYAPDRDLGEKHSIFVPFFGVQAATVTATAQFARLGRARVIPFCQRRLPNGKGYEIVVHPPFENFPTGDDYQDALRVNQFMEDEIRKNPTQYFWAQARFKTRPPGEPPVYTVW